MSVPGQSRTRPVARREPEEWGESPVVRRRKRKDTAGAVALAGAFGAVVAAGLGLILSQYSPVFGDVLSKFLAVPWSPARVSLIPIHCGVLGILGAVGGGLAARHWSSNAVKVVAVLSWLLVTAGVLVYAGATEANRLEKVAEREERRARN